MNNKIRWGILGTGKMAQGRMAKTIQESRNGQVIAIASRDLTKAQECAGRLGIPKVFGSYEALIADSEVDAIYNPLPIAMHAPWSIRCAEAGKPTLCEKPLAANAAEARMMQKVFARRKVPLGEAIMYHYHPLTRRAVELVRSGIIGKVRALHSTFHVSLADSDIRFQKSLGGGGLLDVGCYCVSVMRLLAGEEPDKAVGFNNLGSKSQVDESFQGLLHFPSGILANFSCGLRTFFDCNYEISGSKGRILVDSGAMCAWPDAEFKIKVWSELESPDYREIVIPPANPYLLMVEDFTDAIINKRPLTVPIEESLRNQKLLDRLFKGSRIFTAPE